MTRLSAINVWHAVPARYIIHLRTDTRGGPRGPDVL